MNPIDENTLHEWIFEYLEGNLGATERAALDRHLNLHPQAKVEFEAWQKTYTVPEKVTYPRKRELYKKGFPVWSGWLGAGLLLVIGLSLFAFLGQQDKPAMTPPISKSILNQTVAEPVSRPAGEVLEGSLVAVAEPPAKVQKDLVYIQKERSVKMPPPSAPTTLPKSVPVVVAPLAGTDGGNDASGNENPSDENSDLVPENIVPDPEVAPTQPLLVESSEPEVESNLTDLTEPSSEVIDTSLDSDNAIADVPITDTVPTVKTPGKSSKKKWKRRRRKGYVQPVNAIPLDGDAF